VQKERKRRILRIGLTGGIGSGKSLVAAIFRSLGSPVLSADEIARDLTDSDPIVKKRIRQEFGTGVFKRDGSLDRKAMADIVFSNKEKRKKLNAIVHPAVIKRMDEESKKLEGIGDTPCVIHEAALIYEAGVDKNLDYVIVVDADEDKRIHRVMDRDGISRTDVQRRIDAQIPAELKRKMADFVIENDGDTKSLQQRVRFLYNLFLTLGETAG
jgi:dephospho-CoA kinase